MAVKAEDIISMTLDELFELPEVKEKIEEINKITKERDYWKKRCEELSKNIIKEDYDDTDDKISYNEIVND